MAETTTLPDMRAIGTEINTRLTGLESKMTSRFDSSGDAIAAKRLSSSVNVGSGVNPVYFQNGDPVNFTGNVGTSAQPVFMQNGVLTACNETISLNTTGSAKYAENDMLGRAIINHYAPLASPALTGAPTAPTAAASVKNTQIATTAYVNNLFPTGTCICGLFTSIPAGWLSMDGSRIMLADYPDLVRLLWNFPAFAGDGSTYAYLPNMHHRFFEGTTTLSEVGTYVEAGLPNISGAQNFSHTSVFGGHSGCLYWEEMQESVIEAIPVESSYYYAVRISAERSSSIYGGKSTVQPKSVRIMMIVRT